MIKKISALIFLSLMLMLCLNACQDGSTGSNKNSYKLSDGEAIVTEVPNFTNVTEIFIPDEYEGCPVTKIDDFAAVNLETVTAINIGSNVREIGPWALTNNQALERFSVSSENSWFCDVDGVLFTKDMKELVAFPPAHPGLSGYTVPEGVEKIRTKAFYKCTALRGITLPEGLLEIEEKAFFHCDALESLQLPEGVTLIGKDAFSYCSKITELVIPSSVTRIDEYAFYNCTGFTRLTVKNTEDKLTLGEKWYPTNNNGSDIDGLEIIWES